MTTEEPNVSLTGRYSIGQASALLGVSRNNLRRYANRVFRGVARDGRGTMGWCHGFKLHLPCNDRGEIITFTLTAANVDDRDSRVWTVIARELYGKVFADRGYINPNRSLELTHSMGSQGHPWLPIYL